MKIATTLKLQRTFVDFIVIIFYTHAWHPWDTTFIMLWNTANRTAKKIHLQSTRSEPLPFVSRSKQWREGV